METTIDLPPHLVREMERLACREGRVLNEVAADLLARGLRHRGATISAANPQPTESDDFLLTAPPGAPPMTPEQVKRILESEDV